METKHVAAGVAVVLLVVAGGVGAFVTGFGPAPGGGSGEDIEEFPTGPRYSDGDGGEDGTGNETTQTGGGNETGGTTATGPPFTFSIKRIEQCGRTCRDVTVTLYNEQNHTAKNVTVYTRIYVGNSTKEADRIWQGKEAVGRLPAESSVTRTQRVTLSYSEGYAVRQHDGWVTILTTVQSANETVTFERHRDVT